jgi:hypothetical protein
VSKVVAKSLEFFERVDGVSSEFLAQRFPDFFVPAEDPTFVTVLQALEQLGFLPGPPAFLLKIYRFGKALRRDQRAP